MFERKNQKLEQYQKLVNDTDDGGSGSEDEFITLKRADHDLEDDPTEDLKSLALSKRKLKIGQSKKASAKYKDLGTKLVFDDEGVGHSIYETQKAEEDVEKVREEGKEFAKVERGRMQAVDFFDKEVAKDKKKEKKRKRKERERVSIASPTRTYAEYCLTGG